MKTPAYLMLFAILLFATTTYSQIYHTELPGPPTWQTGARQAVLQKHIRSRSGEQLNVMPDSITKYTISPEGIRTPDWTMSYKYTDSTRTQVSEFTYIEETESGRMSWRDIVHYDASGGIDSIENLEQKPGGFERIGTTYFHRDSRGHIIEVATASVVYPCVLRNTVAYNYNPAGQIEAIHKQVTESDCTLTPEYTLTDMRYDTQGTLTDYDLSYAWVPDESPVSVRVRNGLWYDDYADNILYMIALEEYETYLNPVSLLPLPPKHHLQNTMLGFDIHALYPGGRIDTTFAGWKLENNIGQQTHTQVKDGDTTTTRLRQFSFDPSGDIIAMRDTSLLHQSLFSAAEYTYDIWGLPQTTIEHGPGGTWRRYTTTITADSLDRLTGMVRTQESSDRPGDIFTEVFECHNPDATKSAKDQPAQAPLHLYPNPADDYIQIDILNQGHIRLDLFNAAGTIVLSRQWRHTGGMQRIDIDRFPAGVYLARVLAEGETRTATFVKK